MAAVGLLDPSTLFNCLRPTLTKQVLDQSACVSHASDSLASAYLYTQGERATCENVVQTLQLMGAPSSGKNLLGSVRWAAGSPGVSHSKCAELLEAYLGDNNYCSSDPSQQRRRLPHEGRS